MLHIFYKYVVESRICSAAASEPETQKTEQSNKEGWLCAGDCSGAPEADCAKTNAPSTAVISVTAAHSSSLIQ